MLDAEVELISAVGKRRVALANFITGNRKTVKRPDEILAAVLVPRRIENAADIGRAADAWRDTGRHFMVSPIGLPRWATLPPAPSTTTARIRFPG